MHHNLSMYTIQDNQIAEHCSLSNNIPIVYSNILIVLIDNII